jgi:hypothetical protein
MRAECRVQLRIPSAALIAALLASPAEAARTEVAVSRTGDIYSVEASSEVEADRDTVWQVLTDYEGYPRFVPGLRRSSVTGTNPLRVEQLGDFGILFFKRGIAVTLLVEEQAVSRIVFRAVSGDLKQLKTTVTIEGEGLRQRLQYQSFIEPAFWMPPLIGTSLIRIAIGGKLEAVAEEMERRGAAKKQQ